MPAFNNEKYKQLQKQLIFDRINQFDRLYMEVGGKLFDDTHASRVLPGFESDVKMQIFREIKDELEVIFCINATDLILGKTRGDSGLSYGAETLRLASVMESEQIHVCGIMITFYENSPAVTKFEEQCKAQNLKFFHSYYIDGYPNNIEHILSENGFGKNDYIETDKKLILVSAPGANSGKLETCLSQIFNDKAHGLNSGYAKYETFPVWNLPLNHLTNIAYEMATVDIKDKNQVDPYFSKAHNGEVAVNYNRDIEAFPILSEILDNIMGKKVYDSPTSMGMNAVGFAIENDLEVQRASFEEIKRRHEKHLKMYEEKRLSHACLTLSEKILEKSKKIIKKLEENS